MMRRIIWHHTAGGYSPSDVDLRAYHRLVTGDGEVVAGDHPISANAPGGRLVSGNYAAHTRSLNTGSIGLSMCAMHGADWSKPRAAQYFPRPEQVDAMLRETARLCREYGIAAGRRTVLSHAEVETTLGVAQRGKWDFDYDPVGIRETRNPVAIGDELRRKVAAILGNDFTTPKPTLPVLRRGTKGGHVRKAQRALGIVADGIFGPATDAAVRDFQRDHDMLVDGIVGPQTWTALG